MTKTALFSPVDMAAALVAFAAITLLVVARKGMAANSHPQNPLLGGPFRKSTYIGYLLVPLALLAHTSGIFLAAAMSLHSVRMLVVLGSLLAQGEAGYTRYLLSLYLAGGRALLLMNAANLLSLSLGVLLMWLSPHIVSIIFQIGMGIAFVNLLYILLFLFHQRRIRARCETLLEWIETNLSATAQPSTP